MTGVQTCALPILIATKRVVGTEHYPIIISKDQVTFTHIDLDKIPGFCNWLVPIIPKNSDGYYALMPPAVNGNEGDSYFWPAIHVKIK